MYVEVYHYEDRLGYFDKVELTSDKIAADTTSDNMLIAKSAISIRATGQIITTPINAGLSSVVEFYVDALLFKHAMIYGMLLYAQSQGHGWADDLLVNIAKPGGVEIRIVDKERK